jgi:hypothetical protein
VRMMGLALWYMVTTGRCAPPGPWYAGSSTGTHLMQQQAQQQAACWTVLPVPGLKGEGWGRWCCGCSMPGQRVYAHMSPTETSQERFEGGVKVAVLPCITL